MCLGVETFFPLLQVELASDKLGNTHDDRTSSTAWLMDGDDSFVPTLHERVEDLVKVPKSYSESLQVLHYAPGQQYKVHHDYIQVYEEDPRFKGGHNRMITVFFYLNDVEEGGGTVFPYALMPRDKHDTVKNYGGKTLDCMALVSEGNRHYACCT